MRICLVLLLTILLSFSSVHSSDNKWGIKIELSKPDYVLYEPIWLDVTLTNVTSDTLRTYGLRWPNQYLFQIELTNSEGKQMEYTGPEMMLVLLDAGNLLFDSGEQDYDCVNLTDLFALKDRNSGYMLDRFRFSYIPKGTYTVKVHFGDDISNDLAFSVVEPYGQEKQVLRLMELGSRTWRPKETDASSHAYGEVWRNYPNSPFAQRCYYLYRVLANNGEGHIGRGSKAAILYKEMLREYPNSGKAKAWIQSITSGKSEDEQIAFYDELIEESPDTRASKVASLLKKRMLANKAK